MVAPGVELVSHSRTRHPRRVEILTGVLVVVRGCVAAGVVGSSDPGHRAVVQQVCFVLRRHSCYRISRMICEVKLFEWLRKEFWKTVAVGAAAVVR